MEKSKKSPERLDEYKVFYEFTDDLPTPPRNYHTFLDDVVKAFEQMLLRSHGVSTLEEVSEPIERRPYPSFKITSEIEPTDFNDFSLRKTETRSKQVNDLSESTQRYVEGFRRHIKKLLNHEGKIIQVIGPMQPDVSLCCELKSSGVATTESKISLLHRTTLYKRDYHYLKPFLILEAKTLDPRYFPHIGRYVKTVDKLVMSFFKVSGREYFILKSRVHGEYRRIRTVKV